MNALTNPCYVNLMLVRHGQTKWNTPEVNLMQGRSDGPENELNATGVAQAQKLAERIWERHKNIAPVIYSSNLKRAQKTAEFTAEKFRSMSKPVETIVAREDLQECNFGDMEGKSYDDLKKIEDALAEQEPNRFARWSIRPVPHMETYHELTARAKKALSEIAEAQLKRNPQTDQKVAIFTSGRILRILLTDILNKDDIPGLPNCGALHLRYYPGNRTFEYLKTEDLLKD